MFIEATTVLRIASLRQHRTGSKGGRRSACNRVSGRNLLALTLLAVQFTIDSFTIGLRRRYRCQLGLRREPNPAAEEQR